MTTEERCDNVNGSSEDSALDLDPVCDNDAEEQIDEAYAEGRISESIIIVSDRRSEVTICKIDSVRSCVTACCEAAQYTRDY